MVISIACSSGNLAQNRRNGRLGSKLRSTPAALPGNELEAAVGERRTRIGCTTPFALIDAANSANCSSLTRDRV